jgi:hypothetical protein
MIPTETWQQAMWGIYDETPEVHYGLNFKRGAATRVRFFAAEYSDDPEADPEPTSNQQVVDIVDGLDQGQGLSEMVGELIIHLDVAGEGYMVGTTPDNYASVTATPADEAPLDALVWHAFSAHELQSDKWKALLKSDQAIAYRVWRPHPYVGSKPDSPLRAVSKVASELWDLTSLGQAQARSRIPAKILVLAQDMMLIQDGDNPNPNDSIADVLGAMLIRPITDPSSAGAVTPIIIEAPRDMVGQGTGWDVIDLARDMTQISEREERLIRRVAAGLDLPPEIILGMADINHWGAWLIDEQAVKTHVDPPVRLIVDSITKAYVRQALIEGGMAPAEAQRYTIWRDLSHLVQREDRSTAAKDLFRLGAVGFETLRQANGFGPEDAPDPDELEVMGWLLGRANPSTGVPIDLPGGENNTPDSNEPADVQPGVPLEAVTAAAPAPVSLSPLADLDDRLLDALTEATEAAIQKAMERAGARLRNQNTVRTDKTLTASIKGVDNRLVPFTLGKRLAFQLVPEGQLVGPDDFNQLAEQAERILSRGQERSGAQLAQLGATPPTEGERRSWLSRAVDLIISSAVALTIRRLFTPSAGPDPVEQDAEAGDVNVPASDMWDVLTVAGGGEPGTSQPDRPRGLALGPDARQRIADAGYQTEAYEWRYGDPGWRRTNFPPHLALNGTRFSSWTAPALESYTTWLSVSHYYPGDHRGCRCQAVPVVIATPGGE